MAYIAIAAQPRDAGLRGVDAGGEPKAVVATARMTETMTTQRLPLRQWQIATVRARDHVLTETSPALRAHPIGSHAQR